MRTSLALLTSVIAWFAPTALADGPSAFYSLSGGTVAPPIQSQTTDHSTFSAGPQLSLARPDIPVGNALSPGFGDFDTASDRSWRLSDGQQQLDLSSSFELVNDGTHRLLIAPHINEFRSSDDGLRSYSAEIRIGNVVQFDRGSATNGWYVFAAADGEALSISTRSLNNGPDNPMSVSLDDQITVGDLQAGFSTFMGGTQFTVSYIQTEAGFSAPGSQRIARTESFAGISLAKSF